MAYQGKFSRSPGAEEPIPGVVTPEQESPPAQEQTLPAKEPPRKKRKRQKANRDVTIIFYTLYVLMILSVLAGLFFMNKRLTGQLISYEASRPDTRCEEIFREYFAEPDWEKLYSLAGMSDTLYEDAGSFAEYMNEKTAGRPLTYEKAAPDTPGSHRYLLKLGEETLGFFTLADGAPKGAELPRWQLGQVAFRVRYDKTLQIRVLAGHRVSINGVELSRDNVIRVITTQAEAHLPAGVKAPATWVYRAEKLMAEPQILITDKEGNESPFIYDPESGMYLEQAAVQAISPAEETLVLDAAEAYAGYMIGAVESEELGRHFDVGSRILDTITGAAPWMSSYGSFEFTGEEVSGYCRYSEAVFSARVRLTLKVTRRNGTVKEFPLDHTLFFLRASDEWLVYDMAEGEVSQPVSKVRLTFMLEDTVLFTNLYDQNVTAVTAPVLIPPAGQVLAGWFRQDTDPEGNPVYTLVYTPEPDGTIRLSGETAPEPVTLYALFDNTPDNGGNN